MRCDFVTVGVKALNLAVIGPLVRHVKRGRYRTAVRISVACFEQVAVQFFVQIVDGIIECEKYQLRRVSWRQITWKWFVFIAPKATLVD